MSAVILPFRYPFAVATASTVVRDPSYVLVREFGERPFVMDRELGSLLGYADPLLAIGKLYAQNRAELHWRSVTIDLDKPERCGRRTVQVFDLEGAMRLCELARTPPSGMLYAKLASCAIAEFVVPDDSRPKAPVLAFPQSGKAMEVQHG